MYIQIKRSLSDKEKIVTLLHELLHQDTRFGGPLTGQTEDSSQSSEDELFEIEEEINKEAESIYQCQPRLVSYLEHRLGIKNNQEMQDAIERSRGQLFLF